MTVNNKPNLPREAMPWARDIEAAVRRLEGNGSSLRSSLTATNNLAGSATSLAQAHTVQISEANAKLAENDAALAELNAPDGPLATLQNDLDTLNGPTGPIATLEADLDNITKAGGTLDQIEADISAVDLRVTNTNTDLSQLGGSLATLRDVTVPNLDTKLSGLNSTTLPGLTAALDAKLPVVTYDANKTATDTRITNTESVANTANGLVQGWKVTGKTTIDGGKIEADSVKAAQIAAGTITADKVVLASTRSMIPWNVQATVAPHVGQNGTQIVGIKDSDTNWVIEVKPGGGLADLAMGSAMRFMSGTTASNGQLHDFDVEPGAWYRFRVGVGVGGAFPSGARETRIAIAAYRQDGTFVWINSPIMDGMPFGRDTNNPTGLKYLDFQFQVPADVVVIRPFFQKNMWSGGSYFVSEPLLVRASSAELIVDGAITTDKLTANAVTAAKVAADAIYANAIQANAVVAGKIATDAVTANTIAANAVTAVKIDANAVTAEKILAGTITGDKIAANTITTRSLIVGDFTNYWVDAQFKLPMVGWTQVNGGIERASDGTQVGGTTAATNVYVTGGTRMRWSFNRADRDTGTGAALTSNGLIGLLVRWYDVNDSLLSFTIAASTTDAPVEFNVPANAYRAEFGVRMYAGVPAGRTVRLTNMQIRALSSGTLIEDGSITTSKFTADSINGDRITANTLSATKIKSKTITAEQIAANTITANEIKADTITANEIAADAITANEIAAGAITATELAADAITGKTITGGTITGTTITGSTITGTTTVTSNGELLVNGGLLNVNYSGNRVFGVNAGRVTVGSASNPTIGSIGTTELGAASGWGEVRIAAEHPISGGSTSHAMLSIGATVVRYQGQAAKIRDVYANEALFTNVESQTADVHTLTSNVTTIQQLTVATNVATVNGSNILTAANNATNAEVNAGTATDKIVTPAGLRHYGRGSYRNVILDPDVGNAWQSISSGTWTQLNLPSGSSYNILNTLNSGSAATVVSNGVVAPRTGRYLVNTAIRWFGNTGGTARGVAIRVDAGPRQMEANQRVTSAGFPGYHMPMSTTAEVMATAGNTINVVVTQNTGAALQCAMETFTISYLGPQ